MPGAHHCEQEAKFQVTSDLLSTLQTQTVPLDGYTLQPIDIQIQTDTYFDTPSYDLLRHGLTLRVRDNGADVEVGIKSLEASHKGAIQERVDMAIPLASRTEALNFNTWPAAVRKQLGVTRKTLKVLRPRVVIHQQRQKSHLLTSATSELLAEWSLDEVRISANAGEDNIQLAPIYELEIELLDPDTSRDSTLDRVAAFIDLVTQAQEKLALVPIRTSKAVRGLEAMLVHAHDDSGALTPKMELNAGCRLLLHQQLLQIMLNEHGVRAGEKARFVHDMRVAIRRARAAIFLFGDSFPPGALTAYQKGLKRLGRALGAVRDLDVALANLRDFRRSQPEDHRKGLKALRTELKKRRAHAHVELLTLLDSQKYRRFIVDFDAFCAESEAGRAESPHEHLAMQVRHTVPSIILRSFEAVRAYEVAFADSDLPSLETFHALRIQGKLLRYVLEFSQHLMGASGEKLIAQIQELLEHLGNLNDAHVEQERLHLWAEKMPKDLSLHTAIEVRLAEIATLITELTTTFPPRFANFVSPANRKRLGAALARL